MSVQNDNYKGFEFSEVIRKRIAKEHKLVARKFEVLVPVPLSEVDAPKLPGFYGVALGEGVKMPCYAAAVASGALVYVGSSMDLDERMKQYRRRLSDVRSVPAEQLMVTWLPMPDVGEAKAVEDRMIELLVPVWNQRWLSGFGSSAQGSNRSEQAKLPWDVLHPGREGVANGAPKFNRRELQARVVEHLDQTKLPTPRAWKHGNAAA